MQFSGTKLKSLRKARGLAVQDVARELKVAPITISRYENGKRVPSLGMIESIAGYYDVPTDCLIEKGSPSMDEVYRVNFEKELARELANSVANRLMKYLISEGISLDSYDNPVVVLLHHIRDLSFVKLQAMTTVEEVRGVKIHLNQMLSISEDIEARRADAISKQEGSPCPLKVTQNRTSKKPSKPHTATLPGAQLPVAAR